MLLLSYLCWLIWTILIVAFISLLNFCLDYPRQHLVLYFIPLWWFTVWWCVYFVLWYTKKFFQKKIFKIDILIAVLFSLISIIFIDYICYSTTYIDSSKEWKESVIINLWWHEWYDAIIDEMQFWEYFEIVNTSWTPKQFRSRITNIVNQTENNEQWSIRYFIIWLIWIILWAFSASLNLDSEFYYCNSCKRYKRKILIKRIPKIKVPSVEDFKSWKIRNVYDALKENYWNIKKVKDILVEADPIRPSDDYFCEISLIYCDSCKKWHLLMSFYKKYENENRYIDSYDLNLIWDTSLLANYQRDFECINKKNNKEKNTKHTRNNK